MNRWDCGAVPSEASVCGSCEPEPDASAAERQLLPLCFPRARHPNAQGTFAIEDCKPVPVKWPAFGGAQSPQAGRASGKGGAWLQGRTETGVKGAQPLANLCLLSFRKKVGAPPRAVAAKEKDSTQANLGASRDLQHVRGQSRQKEKTALRQVSA